VRCSHGIPLQRREQSGMCSWTAEEHGLRGLTKPAGGAVHRRCGGSVSGSRPRVLSPSHDVVALLGSV
jgi:hypothetical protein